MKKILAIVLAVVMIAVVFSACASAPAGDPVEPDAVAESAAAEEAPAAEADTSLEDIKAAGKIVMLTNAAFPPYEYLGADNEAAGVDVDVAQAIADEIGVELQVVDMDFDGLAAALTSGKGDMVLAGWTILPERVEVVDFSDTYANASQLIIVPTGSTIAGPDDLTGKTIGVQLGTTGDIYASDIEGADVKQYKTILEAATDMLNGRLEAIVIDNLPAETIVNGHPDELTLLDEPFTEEEYAIGVKKGASSLLEVVNKVVGELKESGKVAEWTDARAQEYAALL